MSKRVIKFYKNNYDKYASSTGLIIMNYQYEFVEPYVKKGYRVLDCGFASGRDIIYFKGAGCDVFGVDIIDGFTKRLRNLGLKNVFTMDFLTTPYDEFFDLVWMNDFISQFNQNDYEKVFEKLYELLKPNGYAYISQRSSRDTFMPQDVRGDSYFDDIDDINKFIRNKFEIIKSEAFHPHGSGIENRLWYQYIIKKI